jgi:hypothetical protein
LRHEVTTSRRTAAVKSACKSGFREGREFRE